MLLPCLSGSEVSADGCFTGFAGLAGVTLAGLADKSRNRIAVLEKVSLLPIMEVESLSTVCCQFLVSHLSFEVRPARVLAGRFEPRPVVGLGCEWLGSLGHIFGAIAVLAGVMSVVLVVSSATAKIIDDPLWDPELLSIFEIIVFLDDSFGLILVYLMSWIQPI